MRVIVVSDVIAREMANPYIYGDADCFFLALDVIDALKPKKTTLRSKYAGRYTTLMGAQKALRRAKHKSMVGLFTSILGDPTPAGGANIGDVAIVEVAGAEHAAIWNGQGWFSRTEKGPIMFTHSDVKAAFKV